MSDFSFIYMRHGRTEANDKGLCSGAYCISNLTSEGREQILRAAQVLNRHNIVPDALLLSPAPRTIESAKILLQHVKHDGLSPVLLEDWRERHMGDWEGKVFEDIRPALIAGDIGKDGETHIQFHARIKNALHAISQSKALCPLVLSHGLVWQAIHDLHQAEAPWIENGGLFRVIVRGTSLTSDRIE